MRSLFQGYSALDAERYAIESYATREEQKAFLYCVWQELRPKRHAKRWVLAYFVDCALRISDREDPHFDSGSALFEKYASRTYPSPEEKEEFLKYAGIYCLATMTDLMAHVSTLPQQDKPKALVEWANSQKTEIMNPSEDVFDKITKEAGRAAAKAISESEEECNE